MQRVVFALCLASACSPAPRTETAPATNKAPSTEVAPASATASAAPAPAPAEPLASTDPTASAPAEPQAPVFAPPALTGGDGKPLPQTEARPSVDSSFFEAASKRLFDAIVGDQPELAMPFFFPVGAYEQVKDVKNPSRDWEQRLVRLFQRDVHEYHKQLGRRRGEARFVRLEVPEQRAEWMKPGREGNRIGYYRVLRSRLIYSDATGKERALEVTSLISWRGEWYVVHLNGFD